MGFSDWIKAALQHCTSESPPKEFAPSAHVRKHFVFSGTVQGVGFRYEVYTLANRLSLTGWVQNLPDGDVEAEIEGEQARIDCLLRSLRSVRRFQIEGVREESVPPGPEQGFHIL